MLKVIAPSPVLRLDESCKSDSLHPSPVPSGVNPRAFYLANEKRGKLFLPPPLISCSHFVPKEMVELLMRRKKDSALGVKFIGKGNSGMTGRDSLDEITNMEGAMHTFVTPVIGRCEIVGDYQYNGAAGGHGVCMFGEVARDDTNGSENKKVRLTRSVVVSASIQMDFEDTRVMLEVSKLDDKDVLGCALDESWFIMSTKDKQEGQKRAKYDETLRRHMIFHLTKEGRLPGRRDVKEPMDFETTVRFLDDAIMGRDDPGGQFIGKYAKLHGAHVISLELLFNVAVHQARNEFSALEALCPRGYIYTYDPASIFAREIGPPILNRLMLAALKHPAAGRFDNLRVFAFNNYAEPKIMHLVSKALENKPHVRVARKEDLFQGSRGLYEISHIKEAVGAMLVIHNNSDGFGQNIETEGGSGSLDGAIGFNSSAAASLNRKRKDLLDFIF